MNNKNSQANANKQPFDQQKYKNEFNKKSYDEIMLRLPKGTKAELQRIAEEHNTTIIKIIKSAIETTYNIKCTKDGE